jgi:transposase
MARKPSEDAARFRAELLLSEIEMLQAPRKQARIKLLKSKQHPDYDSLLQVPGLGPVRVAGILAIVGTPHRFRTKRQFWPYCGFSVVTHTSADYTENQGLIVKKQKKIATRGLNRNHHPQLKSIFKGAAKTALRDQVFSAYYDRLVTNGTKPALALVAVARKLAAITLTIWQRQRTTIQ